MWHAGAHTDCGSHMRLTQTARHVADSSDCISTVLWAQHVGAEKREHAEMSSSIMSTLQATVLPSSPCLAQRALQHRHRRPSCSRRAGCRYGLSTYQMQLFT